MALWQQELSQTIRSLEQLRRYLPTLDAGALQGAIKNMRLSITPHSLRLISFEDARDPLLLMAVPSVQENVFSPEELRDPIGDEAKSPVPFLTHRYPDRVLIYATFSCSQYCRFCFRRFKTGAATPGPSEKDWDRIVEYLGAHPEVDEVILTGGDPWTLVDRQIETMLEKLRAISSIVRIRFHTRVPVNLPSRVTPSLVELLRRHMDAEHPIYVVTHFNHPREIAAGNIEAISRLVDAGIVVRNQSVLLRGVNDDAAILRALFKRLTNIRVVPYYLHQLDLAKGTNHFRVPIERGINIMRELQGAITGLAIPRYMLDIPGGHGKVPLQHPYVEAKEDDGYLVESPFGERVGYHEPNIDIPADSC